MAGQLSSTSWRKRACVILVDANSGWARLPPADYAIRAQATAGAPAASAAEVQAMQDERFMAPRGTWVLEIRPTTAATIEGGASADLEAVARAVNQLALQRQLPALARVRARPEAMRRVRLAGRFCHAQRSSSAAVVASRTSRLGDAMGGFIVRCAMMQMIEERYQNAADAFDWSAS